MKRAEAYVEAGNMIRHYSSSRSAIISFSLPVCITLGGAVISFSENLNLRFYLFISELLVCSLMIICSIYFTSKQNYILKFLIEIEEQTEEKENSLYNRINYFNIKKNIHLDFFDWVLVVFWFVLQIGLYVYTSM